MKEYETKFPLKFITISDKITEQLHTVSIKLFI